MIKLTRIDHINMAVRSLDASRRFYEQLFGFELKESGVRNGAPWAILGVPGRAYLCLHERAAESRVEGGMRINHFGLNVEDFDAAEDSLRENGVPIEYDGAVDYGRSRSLYIKDPDGHEIELSERVGGGLDV